jgi:hypothetical protein
MSWRNRQTLEMETIVLMDEGITGTVTFERYRAPYARFSWWRKVAFLGSFALTKKRFVVYGLFKTLIELPVFEQKALPLQQCSAEKDRFLLKVDMADFSQDHAGFITLRMRTAFADSLCEQLRVSG